MNKTELIDAIAKETGLSKKDAGKSVEAFVTVVSKELKKKGLWVAGADMEGEQSYDEADLTGPMVLVIGSEGYGISRLAKENCDFLVRMPMVGKLNSLNASVAGSILMYESMRQRLKKR